MAAKGDRARLYDVALRLYIDGQSLTDIEQALGVSRQTLALWKADTRRPGDELDEWDKARAAKRSNICRLRALFERELAALEVAPAGSINNCSLDGLTKLGTLVQRWEQMEAAAQLKDGAQKSALFLGFVRDLIVYAGKQDASLLASLETNFDDIIAWGQEKYGV